MLLTTEPKRLYPDEGEDEGFEAPALGGSREFTGFDLYLDPVSAVHRSQPRGRQNYDSPNFEPELWMCGAQCGAAAGAPHGGPRRLMGQRLGVVGPPEECAADAGAREPSRSLGFRPHKLKCEDGVEAHIQAAQRLLLLQGDGGVAAVRLQREGEGQLARIAHHQCASRCTQQRARSAEVFLTKIDSYSQDRV